jgi:hypothetical protein
VEQEFAAPKATKVLFPAVIFEHIPSMVRSRFE